MTLKDVSEATEFPTGYLSQLERGLASTTHDTSKKAAKALGVEMACFMEQSKTREKAVLRSYKRKIPHIEGSSITEYAMTNMTDCGKMLPKLVEILPQKGVGESLPYSHEGEGFVYVLEDVLTLQIGDDVRSLYSGDCARCKSTRTHNWSNQTNKVIELIIINTLNLFQEAGEKL